MAAPWEKYGQAAPAGPWSKYQGAPEIASAQAAPAPTPEPSMQPGYVPRPPVYGANDVPIDQTQAHTPVAPQGYDPLRSLTIGAQGVGRGAANLAGGVGSLPTAAFNAIMGGVDMAGRATGIGETGVRADYLITPDKIADPISRMVEAAGIDLYDRDEMTDQEQMMHKISDYGTQATLGAGGLTTLASRTGGNVANSLKPFVEPYTRSAGATYAGDISASTGAAVADEFVEDSQYADNPLVRTLANLFGGVTGATGTSVASGVKDIAMDKARNVLQGRTDPNAPKSVPASRSEMDTAARLAQDQPTNLSQTKANIDDVYGPAGKFADLSPSERPTVGMAADDIGMAQSENVARNADPRRFLVSDSARRARAGDFIESSAPAGAEGADAVTAARTKYGAKSASLDDELYKAQEDLAEAVRTSAQNPEFDSQNADLNAARGRQGDASTNLDQKFREEYKQAQQTKNALYDAVDGDTPGDAGALYRALDDAEQSVGRVAASSESNGFQRVRDRIKNVLVDSVDEETGDIALNSIDYRDLRALNTELSALRKEVVAAGGNPEGIVQVKNALEDQLRDLNPEAARYYAETYAPKFKTGKAGEYERGLKRAVSTGGESSATRPTEFAQKFLRTPEDANSLNRAIDVNADPKTAADARDWMLGDLAAKGALTSDGKVRYNKFKQWEQDNEAIIDQFPELRTRVDQEITRAQKGLQLSDELNQAVNEAKGNLKTTRQDVAVKKRELDSGPLAKAVDGNAETMVSRIMGSGDPDAQIDNFLKQVGDDKAAVDGLKAGVRDWIKDKAGVAAVNVGNSDSARMSSAKLKKMFAKHETALSKLYTPKEMNALRRARQLMEVEPQLDVKATAGSDTHAKFMASQKDTATQKWRMVEAVLKAKYGVLKGGGILRTVRTGLASLPTGSNNVQDLLFEMHFNPDLAIHLLDRPLKDINTPAWNNRLNQIIAAMAGARADAENTN